MTSQTAPVWSHKHSFNQALGVISSQKSWDKSRTLGSGGGPRWFGAGSGSGAALFVFLFSWLVFFSIRTWRWWMRWSDWILRSCRWSDAGRCWCGRLRWRWRVCVGRVITCRLLWPGSERLCLALRLITQQKTKSLIQNWLLKLAVVQHKPEQHGLDWWWSYTAGLSSLFLFQHTFYTFFSLVVKAWMLVLHLWFLSGCCVWFFFCCWWNRNEEQQRAACPTKAQL